MEKEKKRQKPKEFILIERTTSTLEQGKGINERSMHWHVNNAAYDTKCEILQTHAKGKPWRVIETITNNIVEDDFTDEKVHVRVRRTVILIEGDVIEDEEEEHNN